jgi:two-component system sensor histidine kinase SenX3
VETFRRLTADEDLSIDFDDALAADAAGAASPATDGAVLAWADREAAIQSLLNLLGNAAKYSRERPEIRVRLVATDGALGIAVSDRGIGVPQSEQKRIFDDFYRAPQAREVGVEGTGLGLALVRRHMAAYGGRVELRSTPGEGSTFTLWFRPADPQEGALGEDTGHRR